ncbi:ABC transporter substrate-binding protein [Deinococcus hohokamensis]|uniref:ABC transporter substrate-binding protein n=1 Tax=Deinococcus hohokamensis TaxID=309883 RepID=A0ABV9ID26_9DEIO
MHRILTVLLLPLLLAQSAADARTLKEVKASGVLRLATSADYEPYNYMVGGQFKGFEVELGNLIAKQMGLKPVWIKRDFDTLLTGFSKDEYDLVIASHAITSTRLKQVDFSKPHSCGANVLLAKKGGPLTSKALEGKKLGAEAGSINLKYLQKLPFKKQITVFRTTDDAVRAVALGQVDAVLVDDLGAVAAVKTFSKANLVYGAPVWSSPSGMALAKGNSELRMAVNAALNKVLLDGSYAAISKKTFGIDVRCK